MKTRNEGRRLSDQHVAAIITRLFVTHQRVATIEPQNMGQRAAWKLAAKYYDLPFDDIRTLVRNEKRVR
ncbi:MAG: hypothetical protein JOZ38_09180 [Candidatus Eremiobacteraeota bacterium]|nr:hypothetical protein [Candidatus Eremiobacteraeota bacterium]